MCGCDTADLLHNIPNRPPSPNTLFDNIWAPKFTEVLKSRLQTVLDESEPSRRIIWKQNYGGDAQDTVRPSHMWENQSTLSDENQCCGDPISRLLTPICDKPIEDSQRMQKELSQDWHRDSDSTGSAPQHPSPSIKENCQTSLAHTVSVTQSSSFLPPQIAIGTRFPSAFDQPVSTLSMKLAPPHPPIQFDQGCITSCTPPLYTRHENSGTKSPAKCAQQYRMKSQASHYATRIEEAYQASAEFKAGAFDLENRLEEQFAIPAASILGGCLCGCGGDAMHCLRPNTLPSPNTFYENWWAPHFTSMLIGRLKNVATDLEPSRRIWWRETFGGCAPDREPLASERWASRGDDWGDVLRTSPPPYISDSDILRIMNRPQPLLFRRRPRPHSTTSLDTPDYSLHDAANTPPQAYTYEYTNASKSLPIYEKGESSDNQSANYWANLASHHSFIRAVTPHPKTKLLKSRTHHIPRGVPFPEIPDYSQRHQPCTMRDSPMETEGEKKRRQVAARCPRRNPRRAINFDRGRNGPGKNAIFVVHPFV